MCIRGSTVDPSRIAPVMPLLRWAVLMNTGIQSTEGTTQGDPLAMAMYALAVLPLIRHLRTTVPDVSQAWFADDATAVGSLSNFFPGGSISLLLDLIMVILQMLPRQS